MTPGEGAGRSVPAEASPTQAEKVDSAVVQEEADVPGVLGHGAEGVCTAGGKGVHAAGAHVHEQGPGVAVILDIYHTQRRHKPPHEEPATQHGPLHPCGWRLLFLPFPWDGQSLPAFTLVKGHEPGAVSGILFWLEMSRRGKKRAFI